MNYWCMHCKNGKVDYCDACFACYSVDRGWPTQFRPTTHADEIRVMSDEELAETMLDCFAAFYDVEWSKQDILDWLKQEAEDENEAER